TGVRRSIPELVARADGEPGWSGSALEGSPPSFSSFWGEAAGSVGRPTENVHVHAALEGGRLESPFPALLSDSIAAASLGEGGGLLSAPGVRRSTWASGALRLLWAPPRPEALQVSLAATNFSQDTRQLAPQGALYPNSLTAFEGTDVLAGANLSIKL